MGEDTKVETGNGKVLTDPSFVDKAAKEEYTPYTAGFVVFGSSSMLRTLNRPLVQSH